MRAFFPEVRNKKHWLVHEDGCTCRDCTKPLPVSPNQLANARRCVMIDFSDAIYDYAETFGAPPDMLRAFIADSIIFERCSIKLSAAQFLELFSDLKGFQKEEPIDPAYLSNAGHWVLIDLDCAFDFYAQYFDVPTDILRSFVADWFIYERSGVAPLSAFAFLYLNDLLVVEGSKYDEVTPAQLEIARRTMGHATATRNKRLLPRPSCIALSLVHRKSERQAPRQERKPKQSRQIQLHGLLAGGDSRNGPVLTIGGALEN